MHAQNGLAAAIAATDNPHSRGAEHARAEVARLPGSLNGHDMTTPTMEPIHPGEILMLDYLEPLGLTQHRVAVAIGVPPRRINEIVHGKRGITADTALRLARYFGTSERFWLNLQSRYELEVERDRLAGTLDQIKPLATA